MRSPTVWHGVCIWAEAAPEEQYADGEFRDELFRRFCEAMLRESPRRVIFGVKTHGIACGPVSNTI